MMPRHWPDLSALALLVGVNEHGSLGAASRELGIAQPNASRSTRRLEKQLGVTLIERRPRGSTLTPQGTVIAHWANKVLEDAGHLLRAAEGLRNERESTVAVCASMTVAEHLVPRWLGELRRHHDGIGIRLEVQNSTTVCERVIERACDVGFIEAPTVPDGLNSVVVARDELVVVTPLDHEWAQRSVPISAADLTTTLDEALAKVGQVVPLLELGSSAAVRSSVLGGVGPAVLSTLAVEEQIKNGDLKKVEVDSLDLRRALRAVWSGDRVISGAAGELVRIAHDELTQPR